MISLPGLDTGLRVRVNLDGGPGWLGPFSGIGLGLLCVVSSAKLDVANMFEMAHRTKKLGLGRVKYLFFVNPSTGVIEISLIDGTGYMDDSGDVDGCNVLMR